jgi:CMP-N-acetylneuraminic acid synthetase
MRILAVIAARGGSKGVTLKNIKELSGKPLIAYTIAQAQQWRGFERLIVSTDSEEIANVAVKYNAEVPFMRPAALATDTTGKLEVLIHALSEAERYYGTTFDALLDLDASAPLRKVEDIENIVNLFKEQRPDCVFSVVKARRNPYFNMVEKQADGTVKVCKTLSSMNPITRRQDAPEVFEMNASLYVYDRVFLLDADCKKMPYSRRAVAYEMDELSAYDIDTELDFKFIEFLVQEGIVTL